MRIQIVIGIVVSVLSGIFLLFFTPTLERLFFDRSGGIDYIDPTNELPSIVLERFHPGASLEAAKAAFGPAYKQGTRNGHQYWVYKLSNGVIRFTSIDNVSLESITLQTDIPTENFKSGLLDFQLGRVTLGELLATGFCTERDRSDSMKDRYIIIACSPPHAASSAQYYFSFGAYDGGGISNSNLKRVYSNSAPVSTFNAVKANFISLSNARDGGDYISFHELN